MTARGFAHVQIRLRLQDEVHQGFYYEAQQTYKATFYRYAAKGGYEDAFSLLRVRICRMHNSMWRS